MKDIVQALEARIAKLEADKAYLIEQAARAESEANAEIRELADALRVLLENGGSTPGEWMPGWAYNQAKTLLTKHGVK